MEQSGPARTQIVPLPHSFSVPLVVAHLRTSSFGVAYSFLGPTRLRRVFRVADQPVAVDLEFATSGAGEPGHLHVAALDGGPRPEPEGHVAGALGHVVDSIRLVLGVDDPLDACYSALGDDPALGSLVASYRGLRLVCAPDVYEALLIAVLGQQVSVASAQAHRRNLMRGLGETVEVDGKEYYSVPPPARLAEASVEQLRELGVSRQKARYLVEMARRAADGKLNNAALAALPDEEVMEQLMEIPGVGRWTAEIVLLRGLRRLDAFPAADLGLRVAAQRVLRLASRPSEEDMRRLAERWAGWRSYAALYLWTSLMDGKHA